MVRSAIMIHLALFLAAAVDAAPVEVQFSTSDGITVFGDLYMSPAGKLAPVILLFHQGGSEVDRADVCGVGSVAGSELAGEAR